MGFIKFGTTIDFLLSFDSSSLLVSFNTILWSYVTNGSSSPSSSDYSFSSIYCSAFYLTLSISIGSESFLLAKFLNQLSSYSVLKSSVG